METWKCPLCEDGYTCRSALEDHLQEDHMEDPAEFELEPRS